MWGMFGYAKTLVSDPIYNLNFIQKLKILFLKVDVGKVSIVSLI